MSLTEGTSQALSWQCSMLPIEEDESHGSNRNVDASRRLDVFAIRQPTLKTLTHSQLWWGGIPDLEV